MRRVVGTSFRVVLLTLALVFGATQFVSAAGTYVPVKSPDIQAHIDAMKLKMGLQDAREAAAARMKLQQSIAGLLNKGGASIAAIPAAVPSLQPTQGGVPDYFGSPNWAFSPALAKFVNTLPGIGAANKNDLGQYIPLAVPDTTTYPGSDYYEIGLVEYSEKMHRDLPATRLRGYVQLNDPANPAVKDANGKVVSWPTPHYLGPFISATKDRPVRIKFTNLLPTGAGGDLFLPVDTTMMGAGMGPLGMDAMPMNYTQNRGTLHLHGGLTPWISDGTPHQWITPAGEDTPYPKGVSVQNVPDMPDPGDGSMTFFYTNAQSARLMFYHDHSYGITRLNVYAGEAAGYAITDDAEKKLVADGTIPADVIPLIIQDKTFVDPTTVLQTDPTWNWGTGSKDASGNVAPVLGDLWYPHVYSPAQNPADLGGMNAFGRWHYGPWFWPPTTGITNPPIPNPYYDPINAPYENDTIPATPNPSAPGEAFMDTALVNGTVYPTVELEPKSYRFKILNAADDRFFNLQMYVADPSVVTTDGRRNTEVKMVPAARVATYPVDWPADGREEGVPDPATAGPEWVQIANEGGFLPAPAVIPQQPITWNLDPTTFNFGNVDLHSLLVAPAERADVIVDLSQYAGKTLILYNDAPAAFPARDARLDYYTGSPDLRDTGGYWGTQPGYGPNTRTIMQITVKNTAPAAAFDRAALNAAFETTGTQDGVFKSSQNPIILPDARYNTAYNGVFIADPYARIFTFSKTFQTVTGNTVSIDFKNKALQDEMGEAFDMDYGRMMGKLGIELPGTNAVNQNFMLFGYIDPTTEVVNMEMEPMAPVQGDGTQIWKITHNGVDTHPIHFHLFDVQVINRVGWDNGVRPPDDNELGWKDTVRVSPLEDTIVALRPVLPKAPWGVPDSIRPLDPTMPLGSPMGFANLDPLTGQPLATPITNKIVNFGWEYVWHCHILSHEEMDMMRPMSAIFNAIVADAPLLSGAGEPGTPINLNWVDQTPANDPASWGNAKSEYAFQVMRANVDRNGAITSPFSQIATALANATSYVDNTTVNGFGYAYKVVAVNAAGDTPSNVVKIAPAAWADWIITPTWTTGGSITPGTPQGVAAGFDSPAFAIAASAGYQLNDVLIDGVSVGTTTSVTFRNVTANHTLRAVFGRSPVTITSSVTGGNGSISPLGAQTVPYGTNITFNMTPNTGYRVADVLVDGTSVGAVSTYTFTNATANHTISVRYSAQPVVTSSVTGGNGSISPLGAQTVTYGSNITFNMTPNAGYHVVDVLVDGVSVGAVTTHTFTNVTANHTISVSFAINSFTITPSVTGPGSMTPGTVQTVPSGGTSTFVMNPTTGNRVIDVAVDGTSVGAVYNYTFTNVTANHTILATFAPKIAMRITFYASARSVSRGTSFTTYGYLRPVGAPAGTPIQIQVQVPGSTTWQTVATVGTDATGKFSRRTTLSRRGTYKFRAYFAGDLDRTTAMSPVVSVYSR